MSIEIVGKYALTPEQDAEARLATRMCLTPPKPGGMYACRGRVRIVEDTRGFSVLNCSRCGLVMFEGTAVAGTVLRGHLLGEK